MGGLGRGLWSPVTVSSVAMMSVAVAVAVALSLLQRHCCGVLKYIFYDLRDALASAESLICPSAEPRLCITPLGKWMKASPCYGVVLSRLMRAVARDLHSVEH